MGHVDQANQLRHAYSTHIAHQAKWTKKFIEFFLDICLTNAFLVWGQYNPTPDPGHRDHEKWMEQLIAELVDIYNTVHTPLERAKRVRCQWHGCTARIKPRRSVLSEMDGNAPRPDKSLTTGWCETCMKPFCIRKGCWESYHREQSLLYSLQGESMEEGSIQTN